MSSAVVRWVHFKVADANPRKTNDNGYPQWYYEFSWSDEKAICNMVRLMIVVHELRRQGFHCKAGFESEDTCSGGPRLMNASVCIDETGHVNLEDTFQDQKRLLLKIGVPSYGSA